MEPTTLADAARTVFLTIAPLIATGALTKIGEEISDTLQATLERAWEAVEGRLQRKLSPAERATLTAQAGAVEERLLAQPKATSALNLYRIDPQDENIQRIVEGQIAAVYESDPSELIALARVIEALQPRRDTPERQYTQTITGNPTIGTNIVGDHHGNLSIGSLDLSRGKRISATARPPATVSAQSGPPQERLRVDDATLSADGVHFTYGHALIIGVADYAEPRLRLASGTTANDARALSSLLKDPQLAAYPPDQVHVLTDAKATRANILDELEALAQRVAGAQQSTVVIFFAGHGEPAGDGYALLPYDANLKNLGDTAVTAELFHRRIGKIREHAKRLVVILNCCHAGGVGDEVLGRQGDELGGSAPPPEFYRPLAVGSGQVVISSSRPTQKSGARSKSLPQHTTFGAHLLSALRGEAPGQGAGLGVFELFAHLRATVPADARHISYKQKPLVQEPLFYASQLDDNIAVALRPGWQGGTLGADLEQQVRHLAELELELEAYSASGQLPHDLTAELERLIASIG